MSSSTERRASPAPGGLHTPADADIRRQLERVLDDALFRPSQRLSAFLRFVVEAALARQAEHLKEYAIGVEVFERPASYNPQVDPIVRTMAGRLRSKLAEYYHGRGETDPLLIEIPRGGYAPRFSWRARSELSANPVVGTLSPSRRGNSVGREVELNTLLEAYASVCSGSGAVVTITGEAGMGKTTLAEDFLASLETPGTAVFIARGRCSERLAQTDAFAPVLECFDRLRRGDSGEQMDQWMRTLAPSWHSQVSPGAEPATSKETKNPSHDRMRREFLAFVEQLAQARPVVLFLDDLHWADASTCDLLAYLGSRIQGARVLLIATYRPTVAAGKGHPFSILRMEWARNAPGREVSLSFLALDDIRRFIGLEFPDNDFASELAPVVHERTEGSPLFMTDMLRFLSDRGFIVRRGDGWKLEQAVVEVRKVVPVGIRNMIQLKIDQLDEQDRDLLLCASVQGVEFDSAPLAAVRSLEPAEVEERLQALERLHHFIQIAGEKEFPDGSLSLRCRFVHVFYQNALYASLAPSRRAQYSLALARRLADLLGDQSRAAAADLAVLFEAGKDYRNAAKYFLQAARNAARVFAYPEAVILCERGMDKLASLPDSEERRTQELMFSLTLGMSLMATRGYAAPEVEATHRRSRELCIQLGQTRRLLSVLWGLHTCETNRGDLSRALAAGNEMLQAAETLSDPFAIAEAQFAIGSTLGFMGRWAAAREALERAFETYTARGHALPASLYVLDPYVGSLSLMGRLLVFTGWLDQALVRAAEALDLAKRLSHTPSLAYATFWLGFIHHARHEYPESIRYLESSMSSSREQGLSLLVEWCRMVLGSATARAGRVAEGIGAMRKSIERQTRMGSSLERSYCLTLLADALCQDGNVHDAMGKCDEALELAHRTEGRCYEPETHRVRGEVLVSMGRLSEAEEEFRAAIDLARDSGCRLLHLRAALSYFQSRAASEDGRARLGSVLRDMPEGAGSMVVDEAVRALAHMTTLRQD